MMLEVNTRNRPRSTHSGNQLEALPDEITGLVSLEQLSINSNVLKGLPAALGCLQCLQVLFANGNAIEVVPAELSALTNLKKCNLANNKIAVLPPALSQHWAAFLDLEEAAENQNENLLVMLQGNPILTDDKMITETQFSQSQKRQRV